MKCAFGIFSFLYNFTSVAAILSANIPNENYLTKKGPPRVSLNMALIYLIFKRILLFFNILPTDVEIIMALAMTVATIRVSKPTLKASS